MPRCKTCGTVYSASCDCCPKCSCTVEPQELSEQETAPEKPRLLSWVWLTVGICAFIGFISLVLALMSGLS